MPDAMVGVMGGGITTKAEAREIFRRLMAKARGAKNPSRHGRRKPKKNAARYGKAQNRRRINYGEGNLFNFHGAFTEKAAAVAKEQSIPGAFIRTVWFKAGPRYGVLTRKNSRRRNLKRAQRKNTVAWGKQQDQKFVHQALSQLFPGKHVEQLSAAQLSQVMRLAQALKIGKKNPVMKVPGGWRAVSRRGRMSPVFPKRSDAEIYAESLKLNPRTPLSKESALAAAKDAATRQMRKAGRKAWSRADYNLAVKTLNRLQPNPGQRNYADATELYKKFHGRGPDKVTKTGLPIAEYGSHPELGQLGRMVSLTIGDEEAENPWKKKIEWKAAEAPDLAAEPGGRQLYLIGGSQDLNSSLEALPIDTDKDLLDLGFAFRLEYFTQKKFDNFQPVTYYHDLGEETGDHPRVVYDRVKKRIHLVGGAYEVKPEGIVN